MKDLHAHYPDHKDAVTEALKNYRSKKCGNKKCAQVTGLKNPRLARGENQITTYFGWRKMGSGKIVPQTYCRECRSWHAKQSRSETDSPPKVTKKTTSKKTTKKPKLKTGQKPKASTSKKAQMVKKKKGPQKASTKKKKENA